MPWKLEDVSKHKKGLTDKQKKQWVRIANSVLARCLKKGGTEKTCAPSAIKQANGVVVANVSLKDLRNKVEKLVAFVEAEHPGEPIEDWEYLIHHVEIVKEKEELHHCYMLDHLGNKYEIDHIIDEEGKQRHCIIGLAEDQDVYWSDQEAEEAGETVPCPARQLK